MLRENLQKFLTANMREPFVWGEHDCFMGVSDGIEDVFGIPFASHLKGTYSTVQGALRIIKAQTGGTSLEDFTTHYAGVSMCRDVFPRVGNIVSIQTDDAFGIAIGLHDGFRGWFISSEGYTTRTDIYGVWQLCPR